MAMAKIIAVQIIILGDARHVLCLRLLIGFMSLSSPSSKLASACQPVLFPLSHWDLIFKNLRANHQFWTAHYMYMCLTWDNINWP